MASGTLTIDLDAIAANWRALDSATGQGVETGAVVKADGYGLGLAPVARTLAKAGARRRAGKRPDRAARPTPRHDPASRSR